MYVQSAVIEYPADLVGVAVQAIEWLEDRFCPINVADQQSPHLPFASGALAFIRPRVTLAPPTPYASPGQPQSGERKRRHKPIDNGHGQGQQMMEIEQDHRRK